MVWFCDEFDDRPALGVNPSAKGSEPEEKEVGRLSEEMMDEDKSKYRGLCINCLNRKSCTHAIPEDGIWHCEDYC
jgi:hypothetical protein